jgi:hypothetical protein
MSGCSQPWVLGVVDAGAFFSYGTKKSSTDTPSRESQYSVTSNSNKKQPKKKKKTTTKRTKKTKTITHLDRDETSWRSHHTYDKMPKSESPSIPITRLSH